MNGLAARRLTGVLTDLGYLLLAVIPPLRPGYRRWAQARYARLAPGYDGTVRRDPGYTAALQALLSSPVIERPRIVVEVGAGTGTATALLARRYPGALLVAIDCSPSMLERLPQRDGRVRRVVGDAFAAPLRPGAADLIVVHNAPFDPGELRAALAAGGRLAVVLSSAGLLPGPLRRWFRGVLARPDGWEVRELRAGTGIAWVARPGAAAPVGG